MKPSVLAACRHYQQQFEGCEYSMYLDVRGLVTVGIGNLIDPLPLALAIPFKRSDGSPASAEEIRRDWQTVHFNQSLAKSGARAFHSLTKLHLTDADLDTLVEDSALDFEIDLKKLFPDWESWPADSQLAILGVVWAIGTGKLRTGFPKLVQHCQAHQWAITETRPDNPMPVIIGGAAHECLISTKDNPGIIPRNKANQKLFLAAQQTTDPNILHFSL